MKKFDTIDEYISSHYGPDFSKEYVLDINGNMMYEYDYNRKSEMLADIKNQLLFDILQTLIEIKEELKTKDEK